MGFPEESKVGTAKRCCAYCKRKNPKKYDVLFILVILISGSVILGKVNHLKVKSINCIDYSCTWL